MIGMKKTKVVEEEVLDNTEQAVERSTRQRSRRRVNTRQSNVTDEERERESAPSGFSFSSGFSDDDDDDDELVESKKEFEEKELSEEKAFPVVEEPEVESIQEEHVTRVIDDESKSAVVKEEIKSEQLREDTIDIKTDTVPETESQTPIKEKSAAQKQLDRILSGGGSKKSNLLHSLQNNIAIYNSRNSGVIADDIQIRYYNEGGCEVQMTDDGRLILPNQRVYYKGMMEDWDRVSEVRIPKGAEFEVDLGIGIFLPDGYELEIAGVRELRTKYGLEVVNGIIHLSRQDAMFSIVVPMHAVDDLAYVQKYKSLVQARLVRV